jgi:hypothetical protein
MNQSTCFGSPAINSACPNRDQKFPFRHSRRQRVNLQTRPTWAAEELCTLPGALRPTKLGRDAFHPRPTSFRRDQINKARTLLSAPTLLCPGEPRFKIRNPHLNSQREHLLLGTIIEAGSGSQSAIRNPQSAIRNHFPPVYRRLSGIIGFRFFTQNNSKN